MASFAFDPAAADPILTVSVSGSCPWEAMIAQGTDDPSGTGLWKGDSVNTANACVNPSLITDPTRIVHQRRTDSRLIGTTLRLRVVYPINEPTEVEQSPVVRVFGGMDENFARLSPLRNLLGDLSVLLRCDPDADTISLVSPDGNVENDEEFLVTAPENDAHSWDCDGYEYLLIAVERPIILDDRSYLAFVQGKMV